MSNKKEGEFPSLPQQERSYKQIGDAIGHIPVKFAKKKGGGTSGHQFYSHKPSNQSSQHSQPQLHRNDLSDKAYENLSRINKAFEFGNLLKNNKVLTNCTCCGKIITAEEGFGPCSFCQTNITPEAVTQYYNSADDFNISKNKKGNEDYLKALELRNRLLRWDENYSQTTAVIDEQAAEYGNSSTSKDIWLSDSEKKQREKIEERIKELKEQLKNRSGPLKYTFDFAGKRILLDESHQIETQKEIDRLMESLKVATPKNNTSQMENVITREGSSVGTQRSALLDVTKLKYIESKEKKNKLTVIPVVEGKSGGVVQNQYYIEDDEPACDMSSSDSTTCQGGTSDTVDGLEPIIQYCEPISTHEDDQGFCLSMHQPWCSLLVYGIKRHEGRSWNTAHRGRLWIASTAEQPTDESIQELETYYKTNFNRMQGYPKHYPTSVIVGCVDVIDCVSSEEYRERFPSEEQESDSDYVFICANPRRLFLPYPISGKPKIYKLTKEQLEACQLGLKPLPSSSSHK
ncbi:hypothetical protein C9374_010902 [Naegleria lovaniensis]|uniref:ASCH domain-containing protein n=1 Tax=Naegleria lovaniensis TaxID=51637 RepID=A0AA88KIX8_NAELO|nr:uncharacterized protein C9374_010902 [Naegleria lovaniensis]KAG2374332.1 hypothetical protein C9374_010902 [Naegleria lovaniensis]